MTHEKDVEIYLRDEVKKLGGKAYKFVSPGNDGVPDRLVVLPGGLIFFAELKSATGQTTKLQDRRIEELERLGCDVFLIRDKTGVDQVLSVAGRVMRHEV